MSFWHKIKCLTKICFHNTIANHGVNKGSRISVSLQKILCKAVILTQRKEELFKVLMRIPKRNFITHKLFDPCLDSKNCSQDLFLVNTSIQHLISFRFVSLNKTSCNATPSEQNSYVFIPSKLIQQSSRSVKALCAASGGEQQMLEG